MFEIKLLFIRKVVVFSWTIDSITLQKGEVSDIGRWVSGRFLSPLFLGIGTTIDFLHRSGTIPVCNERLNMRFSGDASEKQVFFMKSAGTLSGVLDTVLFSFLMADRT